VEYAILITDAYQKRELGTILTSYCEEIANKWNMKRIFAETTKDNKAMVAVFKKLGFEVTYNSDNTVSVSKNLARKSSRKSSRETKNT
jgi:acetyltransferase